MARDADPEVKAPCQLVPDARGFRGARPPAPIPRLRLRANWYRMRGGSGGLGPRADIAAFGEGRRRRPNSMRRPVPRVGFEPTLHGV